MSNEIVNCFNGKQCIYSTDCPMYNAALGICRLEPLKTYKVEGVPTKPKQEPTPKITSEYVWKIGKSAQPIAALILKAKPNLTPESIEKMIETEKAKAAGLLTEEAAAHLVATNLGLDQKKEVVFEVGKYIDITGTLLNDPTQKDFERKDGTTGSRTNFNMQIDGKTFPVTVWGDLGNRAMDYTAGNEISFKGIHVDEYKGELQLSTAKYTEIIP